MISRNYAYTTASDDTLNDLYTAYKDGIKMKQSSDVLKWAEGMGGLRMITVPDEDGDSVVGFMAVIRGCVEALYVMPEYRRKGLARQAVESYLDENSNRVDLPINSIHLMHTGSAAREAMQFWSKIFQTKRVQSTLVDAYYDVVGVAG